MEHLLVVHLFWLQVVLLLPSSCFLVKVSLSFFFPLYAIPFLLTMFVNMFSLKKGFDAM